MTTIKECECEFCGAPATHEVKTDVLTANVVFAESFAVCEDDIFAGEDAFREMGYSEHEFYVREK